MSFDELPYLENVRIKPLFGRDEQEINALRQRLDEISTLSVEFIVLLSASTLIATLGLFQNSAAVIIGAMIIAPLMKPLMGLAYGSLIANRYLILRSIITISVGTVISVLIAFILSTFLNSIEVTTEIASRTRPNLLDMGVAIFAGCAGAYCQTRKELADTLAGVAIAVALVPPIGVIGIGLALGQDKIFMGAILLYATNLVGITFAAILVFILMGYGPIKKAKNSVLVSLALVTFLGIPLALSMKELLLEDQLASKIRQILREKTYTFRDVQLQKVEVKGFREPMEVTATIMANNEDKISANQVKMVQNFLIEQTKIPIVFKLRVIPLTVVTAIEVTPEGEKEKTVPIGKSIDTASVQWEADDSVKKHQGTIKSPDSGVVDPFFDLTPIIDEQNKMKLPEIIEQKVPESKTNIDEAKTETDSEMTEPPVSKEGSKPPVGEVPPVEKEAKEIQSKEPVSEDFLLPKNPSEVNKNVEEK